MTPFEATLRRAVADLDALGAPWAMIGGVAVSARSVPRFTVRLASLCRPHAPRRRRQAPQGAPALCYVTGLRENP